MENYSSVEYGLPWQIHLPLQFTYLIQLISYVWSLKGISHVFSYYRVYMHGYKFHLQTCK